MLISLVIGVLCGVGIYLGLLGSWNHRIEDRFYLSRPADKRIAIVAIDDASMARLGRWPWDRKVHAELISKISSANPLAIGYDVNFPEPSEATSDLALADAVRQAGNVVLPVELELKNSTNSIVFDPAKVLAPISLIASASAGVGHANTPQDVDGVCRRVPLVVTSVSDKSQIVSFAFKILQVAGIKINASTVDCLGRLIVNYPNAPGKAFDTYSAADIIDGKISKDKLAGRIILVGSTAADLHDDQVVPTSAGKPMPGVEIHASILDTLLQKKYLLDLPDWIQVLWLLLLTAILGLLVPHLKARWSVPITLILWIASLISSFVLFDHGWIVGILWPSITIVLSFCALMLERWVFTEYKKREIKQAFSHYVSASVVNSLLANPKLLRLGGERKRMTVLFSDVRGFTSISEGLEPELLVQLMNHYLSRMTDLVFKNDGVLDKYIGDAVMAFWNAPFEQADHARRAVRTALQMLSALKDMNDKGEFGSLKLKIGIGINTGEMVVGNMGSENRFDYTVIGDSVNSGSRLESLTKEYGVSLLISESTKEELGDEFVTRFLDMVAVKGKQESIKIYEVMDVSILDTGGVRELISDYESALQSYFARDFKEAVRILERVLTTRPDDGPSKTLHDRATQFVKQAPDKDWDGVWVMTKK